MRVRTLLSLAAAFVLLVVMAVPANANENGGTYLKEAHQNTQCDGVGVWHFVHNQAPKGSAPGELMVTFSSGMAGPFTARAVGQGKTQHWWVTGYAGDLITAWDNLSGKLVLSWYECHEGPSGPS
jgi:hypothetical protein